jgi:hypothetical protein
MAGNRVTLFLSSSLPSSVRHRGVRAVVVLLLAHHFSPTAVIFSDESQNNSGLLLPSSHNNPICHSHHLINTTWLVNESTSRNNVLSIHVHCPFLAGRAFIFGCSTYPTIICASTAKWHVTLKSRRGQI